MKKAKARHLSGWLNFFKKIEYGEAAESYRLRGRV